MTRNYHRLWQRPHWPHRDPPYPDINPEPLHLYTHQNLPTFAPEFDPLSPAASESGDYGQWQDCEEWQDCEPENSDHFDPREPYYANNENSDHFDPREPPDNDDHSDGDYEPNYEEDILNHEFNRLDLEPNSQNLEDYPNYGHYPPDHTHGANKATFLHHDLNQDFHVDCMICEQYIEEIYKENAADYNYDHENDNSDHGPSYNFDHAPDYNYNHGNNYNYDHGPSYNFDHAPDYNYDHGNDYNYDHGPSYNFDHGTHHDP